MKIPCVVPWSLFVACIILGLIIGASLTKPACAQSTSCRTICEVVNGRIVCTTTCREYTF